MARYTRMLADAVDTGMHMSVRYDGAVRRRHMLTNVHKNLDRIRCPTGSQWRSSRMVLAMWSNFLSACR